MGGKTGQLNLTAVCDDQDNYDDLNQGVLLTPFHNMALFPLHGKKRRRPSHERLQRPSTGNH